MNQFNPGRWLIVTLLLWMGSVAALGQISIESEITCQCDDDGARIKDSIVVRAMSGDKVWLSQYSGYFLPDSVLYHAADTLNDEFYLSFDEPEKDTLTFLGTDMGDSLFYLVSYRKPTVQFTEVIFNNGSDTAVAFLPVCVPPDDAITISTTSDTICIDQMVMFSLGGLAMIDIDSVTWNVLGVSNPGTGSGMCMGTGSGSMLICPTTGSGTSFSPFFGLPGSYTITAQGRTVNNCPIDNSFEVHVFDTDFDIVGFDFTCVGDTMPLSISAGFNTAIFDSIVWSLSDPAAGIFIGDSINVTSTSIAWDTMATTVSVILNAYSSLPSMCSVLDTLEVTIADTLDANIVGDTVLCIGETRTYIPNVLNASTLTWTSSSGTISFQSIDSAIINFPSAGMDTIITIGMSSMGCTIQDTFIVDVKDSQILLQGDGLVCIGDTVGYRAMYTDSSIATFVNINWEVIPMDPTNTTALDTVLGPNDSLTVMWGAIGRFQILVDGMTELGCMLQDTFIVDVQDTEHLILGETLACVTDVSQFRLVQAADSTSVAMDSLITWTVIRNVDTIDVGELVTDIDGDDTLNHRFTTGTFTDATFYLVIAQGMTNNGCPVNDTIMVEVIGNRDLAINGPASLCAGANAEFVLGISDTLLTGPLNWSVTQKSNGAPVVPAAIDDSKIDTITVSFPNVADTFIVQAMGMIEGQCDFTVSTEVILTDTIGFVMLNAIDTTCLSIDSQLYALTIDTGQVDIASLVWDIRRVSDGATFFPIVTFSGSSLAAYTTWQEAGEYIMRVRGSVANGGCDIDESVNITVKDTAYLIQGDKQICLGDTMEYVLLQGWNNMPVQDFTMDSVNWIIGDTSAYTEVVGVIGDTIRIAWATPGKYELSVSDSTVCCPINVIDSVLVRDANDFIISGDTTVCVNDQRGYVILNPDGTYLNDLIPDSSMWTIANGTKVNDGTDSVTVRFDLGTDFTMTFDTITFSGMTNDGCPIDTSIIVQVQNTASFMAGPTEVCLGDPIELNLLNSFDSTIIAGIDTVQWIIMPGDTLIDDDSLSIFIDSFGMNQMTWTEVGTFNISALGYIGDSCVITATKTVNVNMMPEPGIIGDLNTCINSTDFYTIGIDMSMLDAITWDVTAYSGTDPNGAMIVNGMNEVEVEIAWTSSGQYFIEVMGTTIGGCDFMYMQDITIVDAANIGQLVCNNEINVTLGDNCELMLTPDMILEQPDPTIPFEQYEILVSDPISGVELSNGLVDASLLGIQLKISITHECSGQSCWGYVTLEDKNIPQLLCGSDTVECDANLLPRFLDFGSERRFGYPVPDSITQISQTLSNPPTFTVRGFEKCGDATLTYNDRIETEICDGDFGTLIYRDWSMTNVSGLTATCTDTIKILKVNIDGIDLSVLPDFTGANAFDCSINESALLPGSLTGDLDLSTDEYCFNIQANWSDVRTEICGNGSSYRIVRTWTIFDWCNGDVIKHIQIIEVIDLQGPNINLTSGDINIEATDHSCSGYYDLTPDIQVTDNCSGVDTVIVRIFENDRVGSLLYTLTDGDYSNLAFDPSVTQIFIDVVARDGCDRQSEDTITRNIQVVDNVMPVPVCDENTTVSIGDNGWAIAAWTAFDDSSYDNCGIESICVTRMDELDAFNALDGNNDGLVEFSLFQEAVNCPLSYASHTEMVNGTEFLRIDSLCRPYVKFCCLDAMDTSAYLVRMLVTDLSGNINFCMVNTYVQDNSPVNSVVNQGDQTISCQEDITPFLTDDGSTITFLTTTCGVPLAPDQFSASVDTNGCGVGSIIRTWSITDDFNNSLTHTQTINIGLPGETFDPAILVSIWPQNYEGEGCDGPGTAPEMLDGIYRPSIDLSAYPCSSLALDYQDLVFDNVEGYCTKIIRTWILIDWCVKDANSSQGTYTHAQILKLNDTVAPIIDFGCQEETFQATNQSNCSTSIQTSATATDCKATEDLNWNFVIKDADDQTVQAGNTYEINTILEVGTYQVTWMVSDDCGNMDECTKTINVVDGRAPAIECRSVTLALGSDGNLTISAQQFIVNGQDNCSDEANLTYAFQSSTGDATQVYNCDNLNGLPTRDFTLQVFVSDEAGNASSCDVTLTLTDDNDACGQNVGNAQIAGVVFTEEDYTIDEVEVRVTSMNTGDESMMMTPLEGEYAFAALPTQAAYEISASRDDDYMNGVTTLDILLIHRHILGLRDLDSPYKMIAADVDGSGRVSVIDLLHIRKLILGVKSDLPIGQPWTFVDAHQTWDDDLNPFPYTEVLEISALTEDEMNMDFIGVKMADVNSNVQLESSILGITRSLEALEVRQIENSHGVITIGLSPDGENDIAGFQLGLKYNPAQVKVLHVESATIELTNDQYTIGEGEFRMSWNTSEALSLAEGDDLLQLTVAVAEGINLEDVFSIEDSYVESEIYYDQVGEIEVAELFLDVQKEDPVEESILLVEQNTPNPFHGTTDINFYSPESQEITMTVYNLTGKTLHEVKGVYGKGWNKLTVSRDDIGGAGAYIYEVTDGQSVIRKKMISVH